MFFVPRIYKSYPKNPLVTNHVSTYDFFHARIFTIRCAVTISCVSWFRNGCSEMI